MIDLGELIYRLSLEDGNFQKGLKSANTSMDKFAKKSKAIGKKLSKDLTLPIVGLGVAALKLASDFEVSSKKFGKAFEGAGDEASSAVDRLNEQYGIANTQATSLLANTGDLLKGFGASSVEALKLSENTQELAAAMGAYNGIDVKTASEIITKAMLGERDSLVTLGVKISEVALQKQLLADGTANLTGKELLLAKARATQTLITEQSSDAIKSFAENQDSAAFMTQKLIGDTKDLAVEFGTIMLPVLKDAIEQVSEVVGWFSELSESEKENIVQAALLIAAIGPITSTVGSVTTAVGGLTKALAFLAANPVALAVIGVVALGIAIHELNDYLEDKAVEDAVEKYGDLTETMGLTGKKAEDVAYGMSRVGLQMEQIGGIGGFDNVTQAMEHWTNELDLTGQEILEIVDANEDLDSTLKQQISKQAEHLKIEQMILGIQQKQIGAVKEVAKTEKEITEELEEQEAIRKRITDSYTKRWKDNLAIVESSLSPITKLEREIAEIESKKFKDGSETIALERKKLDLSVLRYNLSKEFYGQEKDQINYILENKEAIAAQEDIILRNKQLNNNEALLEANSDNKHIAALAYEIAAKKAKVEALTEEQELNGFSLELTAEKLILLGEIDSLSDKMISDIGTKSKIETKYAKLTGDQHKTKTELVVAEGKLAIEQAEAVGADTHDIIKYYDDLERQAKEAQFKEDIDRAREYYSQLTGLASDYMNVFMGFEQQKADAELLRINNTLTGDLAALDERLAAQYEANGLTEKSDIELLKDRIDNYDEANETLSKDEIQTLLDTAIIKKGIDDGYAAEKLQLEKDAARDKWKIEVELFKNRQAIELANIAMSTASAVMAGYSQLGPIAGSVAALLLTGLGISQAVLVSQQPPPPEPQLALGGIITPSAGGTSVTIGEAGDSEAVLPLNDKMFERLAAAALNMTHGIAGDSSIGEDNSTINIILDGKVIGSSTVDLINNKSLLIDARSVR